MFDDINIKQKANKTIDSIAKRKIIPLESVRPSKKTKNKNLLLLILSIVFIIIGCIFLNQKVQYLFEIAQIFKHGKHLVLVQNNAEIRPTGGFIGSIATFQTKYYIPNNFYYDTNIYKRDNDFTYKQKIVPTDTVLAKFIPESGLALRDSNWTIDFPKAATEIAWFYEQEGGVKVDTIVAIDTELFKKILHIIGPIKMVKYNIIVDENNFNEVVQNQVENTYYEDKDNYSIHEPKTILQDMYPIVLARIKNIKNIPALINVIFESLQNKNILLYSYNTNSEKTIINNNWGGKIIDTNNDYLYINNANLGSDKTSLDISENISYKIQCGLDCTAILNIQKTNKNTQKTNKNFTTILTPKGSELVKATIDEVDIKNNIEIQDKYNKNLFRLWTSVDPEKTTNINITYKLPNNITEKKYQLYLQKQPGAINQNINISLNDKTIFSGMFLVDKSF